jgi:hypothetical protein
MVSVIWGHAWKLMNHKVDACHHAATPSRETFGWRTASENAEMSREIWGQCSWWTRREGGESEAVDVSHDLCSPRHRYSSKFQGNNAVYNRIGFEVLTAVVMMCTIFWDITPCSQFKVSRSFGRTYRLHVQGRRISRATNVKAGDKQSRLLATCSAYSSTLKMEAICSSETSADFQRTTRRYIPEDSTLSI